MVGGVGSVGGGGGVQTHFHVKPNSVEVVLRLSWGCDNKSCWDYAAQKRGNLQCTMYSFRVDTLHLDTEQINVHFF